MEKKDVFGEEIARKIALISLCPLDGRYASTGEKLNEYFSEYGLIKYRLYVELCWLKFVIFRVNDIPAIEGDVDIDDIEKIDSIYENFNIDEALKVKDVEKITNHDVKAVEFYIDTKLIELNLEKYITLVHIGCTSEDINSTSYAMMLSESLLNVWIPAASDLISKLITLAYDYKNIAMVARTHGQKATPTTVGKEIAVYVSRLEKALEVIKSIKTNGKFSGATGNYSAIVTAFPNENWPVLCSGFVKEILGIGYSELTTQIEPHDYMAHLFDAIRHFNNIVLDLDLDMWSYISIDYFKQVTVKNEVGSSTMPHKVNPIRFENSESNIDTSNALFMALSNKLSRSRWQRDLSDSSSLRTIGMAFGHSLLSLEQTLGGLNKVAVNEEVIQNDLNDSYEVLAEPIQTVLRKYGKKYGVSDPYEMLKSLTRGKKVTKETIEDFVNNLTFLNDNDKKILLELTPSNYIGLAEKLVDEL